MIVKVRERTPRADNLLGSHRGFRLLFAADAISRTGSQITLVALPLAAILMLHASAQQVGILVALGTSAFLIAALPVGVWVDRLPRRRVRGYSAPVNLRKFLQICGCSVRRHSNRVCR